MQPVIPLKRLATLKMKLLCAVVICLGVLCITTAYSGLSAENESREKRKTEETISQQKIENSNEDFSAEDKAKISSLRLVHVIFRHGDRTPIDRFPLDPYNSRKYWPEGWGKLTTLGKQMQYHLGQHIRKRYDGFLSRVYSSDEIYVQSSDKDRTIQSAMANLAGMWPSVNDGLEVPGGHTQQFVPVHTISPSIDNKIAFTKSCPKYERLFHGVPYHPSEKSFDVENQELYKFLSQHTGLKVQSYFNVSDIYDTLFVQKCHNLTLPEWTKTVFPDRLLPLAERWLKAHTFTDEMIRLRAGPLVTDIVRNIKRVVAKPTEDELQILEVLFKTPAAKFYVYSGHDTTISPILNALGVFNGTFPSYATSLYFELHQDEQQNLDDYYVKIFYRPDLYKPPVELLLKRCTSNPCKYNDFIRSMEPFILDEKQWEKECQL